MNYACYTHKSQANAINPSVYLLGIGLTLFCVCTSGLPLRPDNDLAFSCNGLLDGLPGLPSPVPRVQGWPSSARGLPIELHTFSTDSIFDLGIPPIESWREDQ